MTDPKPQFLVADEDGVLTAHPTGLVEQTNEQYHGGPGISKSHLDVANKSLLHYWAKYIDPNRAEHAEEPAAELEIGTAIHSAILEPDSFESEFIECPEFNMRSNAGKAEFAAFKQENPGRKLLKPDERKLCLTMRDAVHRHPVAAGLLRGGKAEQSFYAVDPETGELVKCRTDYLHDSGAMVVDLKSTKDASPSGFAKSVSNFRYDLQPPWYFDVFQNAFGEQPQDWVFLAVEKTWPHAIGIYFVEPDQIERSRIAARTDFRKIIDAKQKGVWPDYGFEPKALVMPKWSGR